MYTYHTILYVTVTVKRRLITVNFVRLPSRFGLARHWLVRKIAAEEPKERKLELEARGP